MDLSQDDQIMLLKAGTEWGVDPTISVLEDIAWEGWILQLGWDGGGCKLRILYMLQLFKEDVSGQLMTIK